MNLNCNKLLETDIVLDSSSGIKESYQAVLAPGKNL